MTAENQIFKTKWLPTQNNLHEITADTQNNLHEITADTK